MARFPSDCAENSQFSRLIIVEEGDLAENKVKLPKSGGKNRGDKDISRMPGVLNRGEILSSDCAALPPNWIRREVIRKSGLSQGRSDVYYISPTGKKLRSKVQLIKYLGGSVDLTNFDYQTGVYLTNGQSPGGRSMVRAKTVAGGSGGRGASHAAGSHRGSKAHVISTTRGGFDGPLSAPNRTSKNITGQPVTLVHTTSKETRPAPAIESRLANRQEKPRQIFWCKRLEGLRPMVLRWGQTADQAQPEPMSLPNRIVPVGNENTVKIPEISACASLAAALQNPTAEMPVTGQIGNKKYLDSNAAVYACPDQPLIQALVVSDQDIIGQERRVSDARHRLEEALKHFG